ncbi:uncharacterized protein LOC127719694 isoform X2 [Mytilus californianus]|uniref:uncharacterized protein LOC127719694 isoform X2 n=1 Tax=Mytilus californianus TaxID=6549 RepID=UPI0022456FD9|nr:uncharacterized protein LOC127719694 isoform X2 [Mytilus californianus]
MKSCLQTANESEFVSIAFPAFGTGHLGYPKQQVANTMFSCVETFFRRHPNTPLQDVRFVVYDKDFTTVKAFEEEQDKRQIGDNSNRQFAQYDFVKSADKDRKQHTITLSSSAPINESDSYMDMMENLRKKDVMNDPMSLSLSNNRPSKNFHGFDEDVFKMEGENDGQDDVDIVQALFDFNAETKGDLSFEKGDIIIVKEINTSGWWTGIKGNETGYFPVTFTKPVKKVFRDGKTKYLFEDDPISEDSEKTETSCSTDHVDDYLEMIGTNDDELEEKNECRQYVQKKAVPKVLKALNGEAVKIYHTILKEGIENRNRIRLVIFGQKQSGKSLFTRRLLKKTTDLVQESNSLEIHPFRCKARVEDGHWLFLDDYDEETYINERILTACCQNEIIIKSEARYKDQVKARKLGKDYTQNKNLTYDNSLQMNIVRPPSADSYVEMSKPDYEYFDLCEVVDVDMAEEDTVLIEVWDLPGDEESCFAYLSLFGKNAVYIVTVNVTENMDENIHSGLTFWPELIRCLNKTHSQEDDDLSVFIVGTFKDKFDGNDDQCLSQLKCQIQDCTENRHHIKGYYVVANLQEFDDLDPLRSDIVMVSRKQAYWNLERPLRWIHLERNLHKQMKLNVPVMSIEEMKDSVKKMYVPLNDDHDLGQFLSYYHDNGTVVYLKCNPDNVILDPQWLAHAMMLIITSAKSKTDTRKTKEWRNLREYGKLSQELIEEIFSRQTPDIVKHKNLILNLMIRCNIIVRPDVTLQTENLDRFEYGVPCMINHLPIVEIEEKFSTQFTKSSCLCLDFLFLPPTFMAHLLFTCTHLFNPVREKKKKKTGDERHLLFYQNVAVFEIDDTKCEKLMICRYRNVIQFQVWKWGDGRTRAHRSIKTKLLQIVDRLIEERSSMHIQYSIKVKCQFTEYDCLDGMVEFKIIQPNGKYYCDEHENSHSSDEVHVDWCGESDEEECTNDQINAARMAIIILDILGDVLYDLLVLDKPSPVKKRSECDITWLYSQLRNQNQHTPSRGLWGGELKDIQNSAEKIGDDIERVRLTRNGMQHLSSFVLDDKEYFEKLKMIQKVVRRMEKHNKKLTAYTDRVKEVAKRKLNRVDWETYKDSIEIELPRLTLKPSFDVKIGDGCTLDCEVIVALPKGASIYWVRMMSDHETRVIVDAMKYKGSEVGYPSLIILNSSKDDEGYYSCRIEYPVNCAESGDEELTWPKTFLHVH